MSNQMHSNAPSTTHAAWGAGDPHLIVSNTTTEEHFNFPLQADLVTIGSDASCSLVLADTDPTHATVRHDDRDEYVLTLAGPGTMNANPTALATYPDDHSETLRTGAQFVIGPWRLVFSRAEFADHGRPGGGRVGGEGSDQPPQPKRPDYTDHTHPKSSGEWERQPG